MFPLGGLGPGPGSVSINRRRKFHERATNATDEVWWMQSVWFLFWTHTHKHTQLSPTCPLMALQHYCSRVSTCWHTHGGVHVLAVATAAGLLLMRLVVRFLPQCSLASSSDRVVWLTLCQLFTLYESNTLWSLMNRCLRIRAGVSVWWESSECFWLC